MLFGGQGLLRCAVIAVLATCTSGVCDTDYDDVDVTETCLRVYTALESALVSDAGNLYRLRKAFFPAPGAEVALLKVNYKINFSSNETDPNISCYAGREDNSTLINITTTLDYTYGWSLTGIYTVLDPLALNLMQIQLPFMLLRLIKLVTNTEGDSEVSTFLWDGTYKLPGVALNLFITSLNCTPTEDVFKSSINELTMTLKAYAKFQGIPTDYNTDEAGFSLEKDKVTASSTQVLIFIGIFYYGIGNILIAFALVTFRSEIMKELPRIKEYKLLLILIAVFDVCVVLSEFVQFIIVVTYSGAVGAGFFMGKIFWMMITPIAFFFLCLWKKCIDFSLIFQLNVIFVFGQLMFSSLLPTFLLLLVYPIKVISLFAYIVTFIYSVVYFLVALKSTTLHESERNACVNMTIILVISLVYFAAFLFVLLFLLIMTKAAVFAPGVYGVIPLLPPVFITSGIWILKRKVFKRTDDQDYAELQAKT